MKFPDVRAPKGDGGGAGGLFAKFDDKGVLVGVLRGDFLPYETHGWGRNSLLCTGDADCVACEKGEDAARQRIRVNIATQEGSQWVTKIYECGISVYAQLRELHEEGHDLESIRIKITKTGEGKETRYMVVPSAKPLTSQELATIKQIPLKDIRPIPPKADFQGFKSEDVPF